MVSAFNGPDADPPGADGVLRADTADNLGVGIDANASYRLYIDGDLGFEGADDIIDFADQYGSKIHWYSNTYGTGVEGSGLLTSWSPATHRWRVGGTSASAGTERMSLSDAGLTVTYDNNSATVPGITVNSSLNQAVLGFSTNGTQRANIRGDVSGNLVLSSTGAGDIYFGTPDGTWRMRIHDTNQVSIGAVTVPNANTMLFVNGATAIGSSNGLGSMLSVGNSAVDYPGDSGLSPANTNMILNGLNNTSVAFHDSGCCVSKIRYTAGSFHIGEAMIGNPANLVLYNGLVVGSRTTAQAPAAINGTIYYNTSDNRFMCYQADSWTPCIGGGAVYQ